ncbi:AAA family ATPase [Rhizobium sp. LjRoot98]|uniref:AAA family ATPase n=1 Tax=unclassified Rhizobium TaxID=2613769 RepID=UPI0007136F35|nr:MULTISPECIES: AAA family ATPase [unclassified Rhizobium]KQV30987.1 AAA family ATPase [Rhizobium sp. Root1204]KQY11004.1 AAA family ATPase [Rhizobium sp. Root1334]KRC04988.1 AAA family ATPase [Rhizobium sp. Root73]
MSNKRLNVERTAEALRTADRVLMIGCSGSGKSTLAQALSRLFVLPYVSMDRDVFWMSGWIPRPRADALAIVERAVEQPRWIMDGTSPGTLPLRLPRTDLVIWMRPPRHVSLYGVISRWVRLRGKTRPEMAANCPERLTLEFLSYVWNFEKTESPEIEQKLADYGSDVPVFIVRSHGETRRLLKHVAHHASSSRA